MTSIIIEASIFIDFCNQIPCPVDSNKEHIESVGDSRQISIWLDSHDDIFSDFDPRPYSERTLSDDFINELKKVSREEEYEVGELHLLLHEKNRKNEEEPIIVKRIHTYFRKGNYYLTKRIRTTKVRAIILVLAGMTLILLASYISTLPSNTFYLKILLVLFEPAGWFFVWTGMDDLFFASRKRQEEIDFFTKMLKTKIVFASF
jgi:hypothetical protein